MHDVGFYRIQQRKRIIYSHHGVTIKSYQSYEAETFALIDEDLTGVSKFGKQPPEFNIGDVVWQVANEQSATLSIGFLPRFAKQR